MKQRLCLMARKAWPGSRASRHPGEQGVSLILVALMLPVLIGFVGLVTDVGMLLETRRRLQTAVDAGALGGAQELPDKPNKAEQVAYKYVDDNGESAASTTATVSTTYVGNDTITVTAVRSVPIFLMPVLGLANLSDVAATATAIVGSPQSYPCLVPIGVTPLAGNGAADFGYQFGPNFTYDLKLSAGQGQQGNFQALDLYGQGGNGLRNGIAGNSCAGAEIGDEVPTETGNLVGPIVQGFNERIVPPHDTEGYWDVVDADGNLNHDCPRIITIPVVNTFDVNGKKMVTILGFVEFFVVSWANVPPSKNNPETAQVTGHFVKLLDPEGDWSQYNQYGIKLVRLIR
ncbi:MAG: hypothetical protein HYY30_12285 [Chloroflexi bacterium]|nr:hypothetical protein [Chloroflexota bacterium]